MRKTVIAIMGVAALVASPALAQGRGNGGGGNPGGGMGAGPPMAPPGRAGGGFETRDSARDIAVQHGQHGRDFADLQRLNGEQRRALAQQRRAEALAHGAAVRSGQRLSPNDARSIRNALAEDIDDWREEFRIGRTAWQSARDQWLVDRESLTPEQWAERRAAWFEVRDRWIAANRTRAQARGG